MSPESTDTLSLLVDRLTHRHAADLDGLTPRQRHCVARLALDWVRGTCPHWVYPNASPLIWRRVREGGFRTAEDFYRFNRRCQWFDVLEKFSKQAEFARGFRLARPDVAETIAEFLRLDAVRPKPLADFRGRRKRTPPASIVAKDSDGRTRKSRAQLKSSLVAVDEVSLIQARERFQQPDDRRKLYVLEAIIHAANVQGLGPGHLVQQYRECSHGRLMGIANGIHLQTAPREIRNIALTGHWDYDIEACHLSFMFEIARSHGTRLRSIEYATLDKQKFRTDLAQRHGLSYAEVKKATQAISYGAALSLSPYRAFCGELFHDWPAELVADVLPGFFGDIEVRSLVRDVKTAHEIILSNRQVSRKRTRNVLGKYHDGKPQTLVSHILMGYEALALDIAIQHTGGNLCLLVHDGFVSPVQIDTAPIVQQFEQATGLRIRYETNQLCCNAA